MAEHPEHHEHSDVRIRPLAVAMIVFIVAVGVIHLLLYWLFGVFDRQQRALEVKQTSIERVQQAPPEPRLQGVPGYHANTPAADMRELRKAEKTILESYGRTDEPGYVRIPITRAMDLMVQRAAEEGGRRDLSN